MKTQRPTRNVIVGFAVMIMIIISTTVIERETQSVISLVKVLHISISWNCTANEKVP